MHGFYMNSCTRRKSNCFEEHVEASSTSEEEEEGQPERDEIVTINVGGVRFETYKKTLKKIPGELRKIPGNCGRLQGVEEGSGSGRRLRVVEEGSGE